MRPARGERDGALDLIDEMLLGEGCTVGADKGYDTEDFIANLMKRKIKPHVAQNTKGGAVRCLRAWRAPRVTRSAKSSANASSKASVGRKALATHANSRVSVCRKFVPGPHGRSLPTT